MSQVDPRLYGIIEGWIEAVVNLGEAFVRPSVTVEARYITIPTLPAVGEEDILKPRRCAKMIL